MKFKLRNMVIGGLAIAGAGLAAQPAAADGWPTSVKGTWQINANNSTGTLVISTQSAATTKQCRKITGNLLGSPMVGFYCINSGRIVFQRLASGIVIQVYSANLSQGTNATPGTVMGGSYAAFQDFQYGEYNFFGIRQ